MSDEFPPPLPLPDPVISPTPETAEADFQFFKKLISSDRRYGNSNDEELRYLWNIWYPTCPVAWETPSDS